MSERKARNTRSGGRPAPRRRSTDAPERRERPRTTRREDDGDARPTRRPALRGDGNSDSRPFRERSERPGGRPSGRPGPRDNSDERGTRPRRTTDGDTGPSRRPAPRGDRNSDSRPFRERSERSGDRPYGRSSAGRPYSLPGDRDASDERGARPRRTSDGDARPSRRPAPRGDGSRDSRPFRERSERSGDRPYGRDRGGDRPAPRRSQRPDRRKAEPANDNGEIRLNRYLAQAGVGSRREADVLISTGVVTVNGEVVTELGTKVGPRDIVHFGGQKLSLEKIRYVLLNKPKNTITTTDDPQDRDTVMGLIAAAGPERLYPVGRLDRHTTGVLLLTNDGDLAKKLTHPSHGAEKIYHATLDKNVTAADLAQLVKGVELEDGPAVADEASYVADASRREVGIKIHMGRNRVVRRMFEALGYTVTKLDRVLFAGLTKKDLSRGRWRHLSEQEVTLLKRIKAAAPVLTKDRRPHVPTDAPDRKRAGTRPAAKGAKGKAEGTKAKRTTGKDNGRGSARTASPSKPRRKA